MTKPGLRKLQCQVCGKEAEVESGIRTMYCCAEKMVDVTDEVGEEEQNPTLKLNPKK